MFSVDTIIKKNAFWLIDKISGNPIKNAYDQLLLNDEQVVDRIALEEEKSNALKKLIKHATGTCEFYKNYSFDADNLKGFPIIDKTVINKNPEKFISSAFNKDQLIIMKTSGSTGNPFTCYQNLNKKKRVNAEAIFYNGKAGYRIGRRIITLRTTKTGMRVLRGWLQNRVDIEIGPIDDGQIKLLLSEIRRLATGDTVLISYASTLDLLADYYERIGFEEVCKFTGIISISEMLSDHTRGLIEKAFGCRCHSRYSNQENGIIGQDDQKNNIFIVNDTHYCLEVLELEDNRSAPDGKIGRIIITDLYNYAMPLIRYDTGDVGALTTINVNGIERKALINLSGRVTNLIYDCKARIVSPHSISVRMREVEGLRQYQFIQESIGSYILLMIVDDAYSGEELLRSEFKNILGDEADITFSYVKDIPVLPSGKRNYIVNRMTGGLY